jgi:hypothetical protein
VQKRLAEEQGVEQEENVPEGNESVEENVPVYHIAISPKQRKKRVAWTEEEEKFLVGLITEKGAKWAHFEGLYGNDDLLGRSQTAMKDKARNLMRLVIDGGREKEFLSSYPKWAEVTVGTARRGVHGYEEDKIPVRGHKGLTLEKVDDYAKAVANKRPSK